MTKELTPHQRELVQAVLDGKTIQWESGGEWLDDMIRQSIRNELAARAMSMMVVDIPSEAIAAEAGLAADAMMKEMK